MQIKAGVDISRLNREIRRTLTWADSIYKKWNETFVITSTYEGNHSAGSLHYGNDAYDIKLPKKEAKSVFQAIKATFPKSFDIVLEKDHIHVEYDPKK